MAARHRRNVLALASGTLLSRGSGFLRTLTAAYVLGFTPLADAFNLANTLPNSLYDLVIGGVVSASFVSVFVQRLTLDGERKAWRSISSVVTLTLVILTLASALVWLAAGPIVTVMTSLNHSGLPHKAVDLAAQRAATVTFLRWFAPQIFLYGLLGIAGVLLAVRGRFGVSAYAPVANNVIAIGVLVWFHVVAPGASIHSVSGGSELAWLAGGTTLGLLAQFAVMMPALATSRLGKLRLRWDFHNEAVRGVLAMGGWTLVVVVANQVALYVVLALAFGLGGDGPISAYTYGWAFMQMPFAVVVLSVFSALGPELVELHTKNEHDAFTQRLRQALVMSLQIIIPISLTLIVLSQPLVAVLLNRADGSKVLNVGIALAVLAAGLPGFTIYQVVSRALQAQLRGRDIAFLALGQNLGAVVLAWSIGRHSVGGLMASISVSYSVAALCGVFLLSHRGVSLSPALMDQRLRSTAVIGVGAALAGAVGYSSSASTMGWGLISRLVVAVLCAITAVLMVLVWRVRRSKLERPNRVKV